MTSKIDWKNIQSLSDIHASLRRKIFAVNSWPQSKNTKPFLKYKTGKRANTLIFACNLKIMTEIQTIKGG